MRRYGHAIAEVNLRAVDCVGYLDLVKITIIIMPRIALNHHPPEGI